MINRQRLHRIFFYLLVFFIPSQFGRHFWPEWSLVLGRRIDYLSPTLYFTDILLGMTVVSYFVSNPGKVMGHLRTKLSKPVTQVVLIVLFLFVGINIYYSSYPVVSALSWLRFLEMGLLFVYMYLSRPSLSVSLACLTGAVTYSSVLAMLQSVRQSTLGGIFLLLGERTFSVDSLGIARQVMCLPGNGCREVLRSYATFPHPNVLGGFLAVSLPILATASYIPEAIRRIHVTMKTDRSFGLLLRWVPIVLGICSLLLTFSRSAVAVSILMGMAGLFISKRKKLFWAVVFFGVAVCTLNYLWSGFSGESTDVRLMLAGSALQMILSHPWIGTGLGTFLLQAPSYITSRTIYYLQPVHNVPLLVLAETGVSGICFFLFGAYVWLKGIRDIKPVDNSLSGRMIRYAPLFFLLTGIMDHYLFTVQQGMLYFTFLLALPILR